MKNKKIIIEEKLSDYKGTCIPDDVCVAFIDATPKQRKKIGEILVMNYQNLINEFVEDADYATTIAYWKDFTPISRNIMSPADFISVYGKKVRQKQKKYI